MDPVIGIKRARPLAPRPPPEEPAAKVAKTSESADEPIDISKYIKLENDHYVCTFPGCRSDPFYLYSLWHRHVNTHTKPVKCPDCGLGFALSADMRRHASQAHASGSATGSRISPGRFVVNCPTCDKPMRRDNLKRHSIVHTERPDGKRKGKEKARVEFVEEPIIIE